MSAQGFRGQAFPRSRATCCSRATGPLTRELVLRSGRLRARPGAGAPQARRDDHRRVRLLLDRLRARRSTCANGEAVNLTPTTRLSGEPRHGLPQGLGGAAPCCDSPDRATTPLLRDAARQAAAGRLGRRRMRSVRRPLQGDPGGSTARSRSRSSAPARSPTEEMALLGALAKFGMGMVHGDGNTRQCMATSVVAYKQSFGFDAPPYTYADFEESDVHRARRHRTCASPIRSCGSACCATRISRRSSSSIRARPRPRWPPRSTCALHPKSRPARCSTASRTC